MQHRIAAVLGMAGLALAQLTPPGGSNLGIPAVPGTRVPESNPGTVVSPPPAASSGSSAPAANSGTAAPAPGSNGAGPAYSFGAAPPPVIAPGK